jgi:DNA-binding HxlR family transcriptional regulator
VRGALIGRLWTKIKLKGVAKNYMTEKRQGYTCSMEAALSIISGKWKLTILNRLIPGPQRYTDLRKLIPRITEKMLTQQLREMEEDGIIKRKVYPVVPPKVEYSFTELGQQLTGIFQSLSNWGRNFLPEEKKENSELVEG